MPLYKDGKVSGTLPDAEVFAVHYPGYPSSTSRAIDTLGGSEAITKIRSSLNKLELRFRPEDPHAHPAFGQLRSCNNFLLKLSKKKSFYNGSSEASNRAEAADLSSEAQVTPSDSELVTAANDSELVTAANDAEAKIAEIHHLHADVVARVSECYHFDGMADYQHVIPVHAEVARRKKRAWIEMEEPLTENGNTLDLAQEDVMMLLPPLFAPKDIPENLVLRPPPNLGSKKKLEEIGQKCPEMDLAPALAIDFSIKEVPKKINWEDYIHRDSEQWSWQVEVSKLFDEKPIWHKVPLTQRLLDKGLRFAHHMLNRLLLRVAYYFSGGPYLRLWIIRGYDPRKDPDSRIYQRTDFRVPPELRSYCAANIGNESKQSWEDLCAFRVFPFKCSTLFQLSDLQDDFIQQEIRKPPKQTTCSFKTGWFSERMVDTLRLRVAVRFLSVYPYNGANSMLKATVEEFEKSKKSSIYKNVLKHNRNEIKQINTGGENDERPNGNIDEVEDEIEVGEDEVEVGEDETEIEEEDNEELDAYEALDLAGDGDENLLQSHSYMDNNSRMYLQELFGSFPASEVETNKIQDDGSSGGEYQIYEQESDDSFSDDADADADYDEDGED